MSEYAAALGLPTLTARDGTIHTAARQPRLKDGRGFIEALEATVTARTQLDAAHALLLGMGFPEAVVDDLDLREAVEKAMAFFTAALQPPPSP